MNRSFYALIVGQTSTNVSFALYTMVVVLYIYQHTNSTTFASFATLMSMLARIGSSMFLPTLSDRLKLTQLIVYAQLTQLIFYSFSSTS